MTTKTTTNLETLLTTATSLIPTRKATMIHKATATMLVTCLKRVPSIVYRISTLQVLCHQASVLKLLLNDHSIYFILEEGFDISDGEDDRRALAIVQDAGELDGPEQYSTFFSLANEARLHVLQVILKIMRRRKQLWNGM